MTVRFAAAACLLMLPLCSSAVASPLGVLTAPFASKVLIQQREQAAREKSAENNTTQARAEACQASLEQGARPERADDKPARCEISEGNVVADRNGGSENALPDADKKRSSD
ncbi:hypothetical protein GCM10027321_46640 [Massilia terrae]|uniref:Secreted protein n=1 Tax=Massilia terrae TaxID=1811224 RepID=A0ABT2CSF2_9BURK|nr:hypothetical protein [Massilia terrae]MCS0656896.1 hypothetical protein [Massilia terrae]